MLGLQVCATMPGLIRTLKKLPQSWMWWAMPVIPVLGRLRKKDCKFKASLGNLARRCFKKSQVWWHTLVILAFGRLRPEDHG